MLEPVRGLIVAGVSVIALWFVLSSLALADDPADVDAPIDPPTIPADVEQMIGVPGAQTAQEADPSNPTTDKLMRVGEERHTVEAEEEEPSYLEVLVIGQQQVTAARDAVVREMEALGWRTKKRGDGTVLFRGPEAWMGRATLYPSGDLDFDQPGIALQGPRQTLGGYDPNATSHNQFQGGTAGVAIAMPSKDKVLAVQREIRDAVQDEVVDYRHKLQQRYFSSYIDELPKRLDAAWLNGESLDGAKKPLATPADRRRAILEFWASRTDTPEGRTVSRQVEIWLRETVMGGPDPVTPAEAVAAEQHREDGRKLDIFPTGRQVMQVEPAPTGG